MGFDFFSKILVTIFGVGGNGGDGVGSGSLLVDV